MWFSRFSRWNYVAYEGRAGGAKWYLEALIKALKICREKEEIRGMGMVLATDSAVVVKGMTVMVAQWKRKGWRGDNRKEIEHRELWEEAETLIEEAEAQGRNVKFWLIPLKQNYVSTMGKPVETVNRDGRM